MANALKEIMQSLQSTKCNLGRLGLSRGCQGRPLSKVRSKVDTGGRGSAGERAPGAGPGAWPVPVGRGGAGRRALRATVHVGGGGSSLSRQLPHISGPEAGRSVLQLAGSPRAGPGAGSPVAVVGRKGARPLRRGVVT